ncbi:MAG: NnrS family protein [Epsilonproteobacteria bacterium]|nr:NnrS family protein [Campylobacterota bacterium]
MNFSTSYDFIPLTPQKPQSWWSKFTSQSHQLFFTSAIFFAITIMIATFISLIKSVSFDFHVVHSFGLIFGVFTNAFLGFLLTVIPKYTAGKTIDKQKYIISWIIFQIGMLIGLFGFEEFGKIIVASTIFYINVIFYQTIKNGNAFEKKDSIALNLLLFFGGVFLLAEALSGQSFSKLIFFGYLLSLVFIVAQRMIPAFYSVNLQIIQWEKPKYLVEVSMILFLILGVVIQFEFIIGFKIASLFAMIFFGYIIFNLNIYQKAPAILTILMVAFVWLEIAFVVLFLEAILETQSLMLAIHIFAIGFVGNLLVGFGSRVVMGHAVPAQKIEANKFTLYLFILLQIVVITRITASLLFLNNSPIFMGFLHLSAWLWIILFIGWVVRYGKTLLRV